jgi:hypothetical protein
LDNGSRNPGSNPNKYTLATYTSAKSHVFSTIHTCTTRYTNLATIGTRVTYNSSGGI